MHIRTPRPWGGWRASSRSHMANDRAEILTRAAWFWLRSVLNHQDVLCFSVCFSVIPGHLDYWELLLHCWPEDTTNPSWGEEQQRGGQGGGALSASTAQRARGPEPALVLSFAVSSSDLPALLCKSWVQSLELCPGKFELLSGSALSG